KRLCHIPRRALTKASYSGSSALRCIIFPSQCSQMITPQNSKSSLCTAPRQIRHSITITSLHAIHPVLSTCRSTSPAPPQRHAFCVPGQRFFYVPSLTQNAFGDRFPAFSPLV